MNLPSADLFPKAHLPIAVDVAGSDNGIANLVDGAIRAKRDENISSILVGPENDINDSLRSLGAKGEELRVVHAPEVITMHESPVKAVRKKINSSLCVGYQLIEKGVASSIISAGNSGAMMAAGRLICGQMPGIERPAIAALLPVAGRKDSVVILDSGANVECHSHNLIQFAVMGSIYCSALFKKEFPKIFLLSNGTEETKGTDIIRTAASYLRSMNSFNYQGYIEGREVLSGRADVVVCDGFVGNVMLKSMEGSVQVIMDHLKVEAQKGGLLRKIRLSMSNQILNKVLYENLNYQTHGGAPLLGLRQLAIVLHGSSNARAVKSSIELASCFSSCKMTEKIGLELGKLDDLLDLEGDIFLSKDLKMRNKKIKRVPRVRKKE